MGNSIEPNTKEYYQLQSEYWFNECCKCTNACNELINDIEEVKRKAEAWIDLKKEMIEMYPILVVDVETTSGECEKGMLYQLGKHLRRMDELDGTQEFRNLLSDLERGSDE